MNNEADKKLNYIRQHVENRRRRQGINTLSTEPLPEGSCIAAGEMDNLLYQLVHTREPYGGQVILKQPDIALYLFNHVITLNQ